MMVSFRMAICLFAGMVSGALSTSLAAEDGFARLFDGESLDGWEGNPEFFRVKKAALVAGTLKAKIPHNQFLATKRKFGDFELRLEAKLVGEGQNAGVQFRSKRVGGSTEVEGYQCDAGAAWDRPVWGALYDESRRRKMLAEGPKDQLVDWVKQDQWNELRVVAAGKCIELYLNGNRTVRYIERDADIPESGIIALQIHSGPPTEAWYRNVRIREIGKTESLRRQKIFAFEELVERRMHVVENGLESYTVLLDARKLLLDAKLELADSVESKRKLLEEKIECQAEILEHKLASPELTYETQLLEEVEMLNLRIQLSELGSE